MDLPGPIKFAAWENSTIFGFHKVEFKGFIFSKKYKSVMLMLNVLFLQNEKKKLQRTTMKDTLIMFTSKVSRPFSKDIFSMFMQNCIVFL
jgi:hypothetical protein